MFSKYYACFGVIIIIYVIAIQTVQSYQINVYYTDSKLTRFGGKLNTFTDKEFTQLIHHTPNNVHFIPTTNGKSYFASITTASTYNIIKNLEETKKKSYEPIILNPSDFFSLFPSCSINNNVSKQTLTNHENKSSINMNDNELYSYLGMKNNKHYISVELSKHIQDEAINNNNTIDVESLLYTYSISKFIMSTKTSSIRTINSEEVMKQTSTEYKDISNSNNSYNISSDQPLVKIISCNLRKVINDYYEDDKDESKQFSTILALAGGFSAFHSSTRFCRKCGSQTKSNKCGTSRVCTNIVCKSSSYPRIEPASIMLIQSSCGEYCLLGRKAVWAPGCYSTLAGFTELGESLEQTVERETMEESGVQVDPTTVQYIASQPWPFPSSLMIGFQASAFAAVRTTDAVSANTNVATKIKHDDNKDENKSENNNSSTKSNINSNSNSNIENNQKILTEITETRSPLLPKIEYDKDEMEDVQWFSKSIVKKALVRQFGGTGGFGSSSSVNNNIKNKSTNNISNDSDSGTTTTTDNNITNLTSNSSNKCSTLEDSLHFPGPTSLSRILITQWCQQ